MYGPLARTQRQRQRFGREQMAAGSPGGEKCDP